MPPGISDGLRGSVGAKHSHETGLDTDLQALTRRYQVYAAGTEWYGLTASLQWESNELRIIVCFL